MSDAIVARSTPPGRGAIATVRLSGTDLSSVMTQVVRPHSDRAWRSRVQRRVDLVDADGVFDDGLAVYTAGPATFTGEDTLEVSLHGNPLLVDRLIAACVAVGARLARPGEFTRRAVEHGKLDLVQAEGIDQLVRARTTAGLAVARQGLAGALSSWLADRRHRWLEVAAELEARLDHPDDELVLVDDDTLCATLRSEAADCRALAATEAAGRVRVEGARVALVGPVNAGKSSLFNALLGRARALVHDRPGTTRDVVEVPMSAGGLELTLLDTAGERVTDDPVEAAGLALARSLVDEADLLVVVLRRGPDDEVERLLLQRTRDRRRVVVVNGIDRAGAPEVPGALRTSAVTGEGVEALREALVAALPSTSAAEGLQLASERQAERLGAVALLLEQAAEALPVAGPAAAADALTEALERVDELTGADTREDVLSALFARFCIGK
jgi:tRNA modification GTPase